MEKRVVTNTAIQIVGKGITVLISLLTTATLTRKLGLSDYGLFALTTSLLLLFDAAADMGSRIIGAREMAKTKSDDEAGSLGAGLFQLRLLVTTIVGLAAMVFVGWYTAFEGRETEIMLAVVMMWGTSVAGFMEAIFIYKERLDRKIWMDIAYPAIFLAWLIIGGEKISLGMVFGVYLAARIMSLGVGWWLVGRLSYQWQKEFGKKLWVIDKKLVNKLFWLSWPMGWYLLLFTSYDKAVDSLFLQKYWGEETVAIYGLAYKIYSNLVMPAYFLVSSMFAGMTREEGVGGLGKALKLGELMAGLIVIGTLVGASLMIGVLGGQEYGASVGVLRVLSLALFAAYAGHILGFKLIAIGGQKQMLGVGLTALVINIGLNIVIIPYLGAMGAAIVTVVTETTSVVVMWIILRSHRFRLRYLEHRKDQ